MDKIQKKSSSGSDDSFDFEALEMSDEAENSLESISGLKKKFESSLYVSKKHESISTESNANEQGNFFKSSSLKKLSSKKAPRLRTKKSNSKKNSNCSYKASSKIEPESTKSANNKSLKLKPNQDVGTESLPFKPKKILERKNSASCPNLQHNSSTDPKPIPSGNPRKVNPSYFSLGTNSGQYRACAYLKQRFINPTFYNRNDMGTFHYQSFHSASGSEVSPKNPPPPDGIQNKVDLTHKESFALPTIQPQNSSPEKTDSQNTSTWTFGKSKKLTNWKEIARIKHYPTKNTLSAGKFSQIPPTALLPKSTISLETMRLRQFQRCSIQFPTPSVSSFGSNYSMGQRIIPQQQFQQMRTYAEPPTYGYSYIHPVITEQAVIRSIEQNTTFIESRSNACNLMQPTNQTSHRIQYQPSIQNLSAMTLFQGPNPSGNQYGPQYQPSMQNRNIVPQYQDRNHSMNQYGTQYLPSMQNLTTVPQYQYRNPPMYHYGIQHQPSMQNPTTAPQYQNNNYPMYQYGTQYQSSMQSLNAESQYQNPNRPMYQHEKQYQPTVQSLTKEPQYQDRNHPMYRYGSQYQQTFQNPSIESQYWDPNSLMYKNRTRISLETSKPPEIERLHSKHDAGISTTQNDSNAMLMQRNATNPFLTDVSQNSNRSVETSNSRYPIARDSNPVPNISSAQTSVENPIASSLCGSPQWFYAPKESRNKMINDPNQGSIKRLYSKYDATTQNDSNAMLMQRNATNPFLIDISQNSNRSFETSNSRYPIARDSNLVPNISSAQTSVENPIASSVCGSQYPQWYYTPKESTNKMIDDPNQGSIPYQECGYMNNPQITETNTYVNWSISTDDSNEYIDIENSE